MGMSVMVEPSARNTRIINQSNLSNLSNKKNMAFNQPSHLLRLPTELRLKIYEYALSVPNEYSIEQPLIVVNDRGNAFTSRGRYRALQMSPSWVGEDGTTRKLLRVNRRIHDEAEDFLLGTCNCLLRRWPETDTEFDLFDCFLCWIRSKYFFPPLNELTNARLSTTSRSCFTTSFSTIPLGKRGIIDSTGLW